MEGLPLIFAFDCEGRGPNHIKHGLVSLGYVVGNLGGHILEQGRFDMLPLLGQVAEANTMNDFYYRQNPGLFEALSENAKPAQEQMTAFNALLTRLESTSNLYILTDAPSYDASLVNYYLQLYDFLPLHFTRAGEFRPVHDADSYARGFERMDGNQMWVSDAKLREKYEIPVASSSGRAHFPEFDAENIYRTHVGLLGKIS